MPDTPDNWDFSGAVPSSTDYSDLIEKHAKRTGLDPNLLRAVMGQESRGKPRAVSPRGATGLMQLMPATAARFGVRDPTDPDQNIAGGADYLAFLNKRYNGDLTKTLAAYNAGEGAVDKFGGIPPYKETQAYVPAVKARYQQLGGWDFSGSVPTGGQHRIVGQRRMQQVPRKPAPPATGPFAGVQGEMHGEQVGPQTGQPIQPRKFSVLNIRDYVRQGRQAENALTRDPNLIAASWGNAPVDASTQARIDQARAINTRDYNTEAARTAPNVYLDSGMPAAVRAVVEPLAKGYGGLADLGAGLARTASDITGTQAYTGSKSKEVLGKLADTLAAKARELKGEAETADERAPLRGPDLGPLKYVSPAAALLRRPDIAGNVGAGLISSAPAVAAMEAGVPGPIAFAAQNALEAYGADPNARLSDLAGAAGQGGLQGSLFEAPITNPLVRAGVVGAGTTLGLAGAGAPLPSSLESGAVNAIFAGMGARRGGGPLDTDRAGITPEGVRTGPVVQTGTVPEQISTAFKQAAERTGVVSPEAADRAVNQPIGPSTRLVADPAVPAAVTSPLPQQPQERQLPGVEIVPPRSPVGAWRVRFPNPAGGIITRSYSSEAEARRAATAFTPDALPAQPQKGALTGALGLPALGDIDEAGTATPTETQPAGAGGTEISPAFLAARQRAEEAAYPPAGERGTYTGGVSEDVRARQVANIQSQLDAGRTSIKPAVQPVEGEAAQTSPERAIVRVFSDRNLEDFPLTKDEKAAAELETLPPPREGYTRLYRGDKSDAAEPDERLSKPRTRFLGQWFDTNPKTAGIYGVSRTGRAGKVSYIDIPTEELDQYHALTRRGLSTVELNAGVTPSEYILPSELAATAKEVKLKGAEPRVVREPFDQWGNAASPPSPVEPTSTGKWRGQEGFVGERRPIKPPPAGAEGMRSGAVADRTSEGQPTIGIVDAKGVVEAKPDPARNLNHSRAFNTIARQVDQWHYEPTTETVYWTAGDNSASPEAKHAVENYLFRQGDAVKRHADYSLYLSDLDRIQADEAGTPATHHSTFQPREEGRFSGPPDYTDVRAYLTSASRRVQEAYRALQEHPARREGLHIVNADTASNYFDQLRRFVSTHTPDRLPLVEKAEQAFGAGKFKDATLASEQALTGTHDFMNQINGAMLAAGLLEKGVDPPAHVSWVVTLREVQSRLRETGLFKAGGGGQGGFVGEGEDGENPNAYNVTRYPKGGLADHEKIAYIIDPVVQQLKADVRTMIDAGKLAGDKVLDFVRSQLGKMFGEYGPLSDWHELNRRSAYRYVTDQFKSVQYNAGQWQPATPATSKYVDTEPLQFEQGKTARQTATDIRREYTGAKNRQVVMGEQIARAGKRAVRDPLAQSAIYFYNAVNGSRAELARYAADADPRLDASPADAVKIKSLGRKFTYRDALQRALQLTPAEREQANILRTGYDELGDYSRSLGTIRSVKEAYHNRVYTPEQAGKRPGAAAGQGLSPYTAHSKQQYYANVIDAVLGRSPDALVEGPGKKIAVSNAFDAYNVLNAEMARANTNAKMREALTASGLGAEVPAGRIPTGFAALNGMGRDIPVPVRESLGYKRPSGWGWNQRTEEGAAVLRKEYVVPEGIAHGLAALTNPDLLAQWKPVRALEHYQGLVKTIDLSFSAFHHLALASQLLYQSGYGLSFARNLPKIREWSQSGAMDAIERDFTRHTGMTTRVESNADVLRKLVEGDDVIAKLTRLPVLKQGLQAAEFSSDILFDHIQRYLKLIDYQNKVQGWLNRNTDATPRQLVEAKRSIASEINAAYGGLNWEAMGFTKTTRTALRLALLAPDWTLSNGILLGKSWTGGPGGAAARRHLITAAVVSGLLTEGLNRVLSGHSASSNEAGHELEVEVSPGVYVSLFRGGIGDIAKLYSLVESVGPVRGAAQFASNKAAPLPRTAIGLISNYAQNRPLLVPYNPSKSWLENTAHQIAETATGVAAPAIPLPIGASQTYQYLKRGDATPVGLAAVATGLGRSTSGRGPRTPAEKYMSQLSLRKGKDIYEDSDESEAKYQIKSQAIDAARAGRSIDQQLNEAANSGKLSASDIKQVLQDSQLTRFQYNFKRLKLEPALEVWGEMNSQERQATEPLLWKKVEGTLPKRSPVQQRQIEQRLKQLGLDKPASGISQANQLGVPLPIPARRANEDDLAYRARLLQTGRARRTALDRTVASPEFASMNPGQQRKSLRDAALLS